MPEGTKVDLRTWYTDCIVLVRGRAARRRIFICARGTRIASLCLFCCHDDSSHLYLRTWYTDCIGKHAQILLHIRRRFYLIALILADVR